MPQHHVPRLQQHYREHVVAALMKEFNYASVMQVPRLVKVSLNIGVGEGAADRKKVEAAAADLTLIAGQKAEVALARKSVANFKVRQGWPIGCKVTLRRRRMYEFLDRLVSVALPRIRDFRGIPRKSFDGCGNLSLGIREQIIFPEIDYDKIDALRGLDVTIVTSTPSNDQAYALLKAMRFPLRT